MAAIAGSRSSPPALRQATCRAPHACLLPRRRRSGRDDQRDDPSIRDRYSLLSSPPHWPRLPEELHLQSSGGSSIGTMSRGQGVVLVVDNQESRAVLTDAHPEISPPSGITFLLDVPRVANGGARLRQDWVAMSRSFADASRSTVRSADDNRVIAERFRPRPDPGAEGREPFIPPLKVSQRGIEAGSPPFALRRPVLLMAVPNSIRPCAPTLRHAN